MVLALGAALAVGNLTALIRPRPVDAPTGDESEGEREAAAAPEFLERPPLMRSLIMIVIGTVASVWAIASLMG